MDMLGQPKFRLIITESYQTSDEPRRVRDEITEVRYDAMEWRDSDTATMYNIRA